VRPGGEYRHGSDRTDARQLEQLGRLRGNETGDLCAVLGELYLQDEDALAQAPSA
jgi:hypothetical protein